MPRLYRHSIIGLACVGLLAVAAYLFLTSGSDNLAGFAVMPTEIKTSRMITPEALTAFGRKIQLTDLKNPLSKLTGALKAKQIAAGQIIYFKNCVFCHGATLDGNGIHAKSLIQQPADFTAENSVAKLSDSHLFWRITKGATTASAQKTGRFSAMPAWENRLSETQIWQVILYLRNFVGQVKSGNLKTETSAAKLYSAYCEICHGPEGDGAGKAADRFSPHPRDFTIAEFKFRTSGLKAGLPADADLARIIRHGLPGTAMAGWGKILSDAQILQLGKYLKKFGEWEDETIPSIALPQKPTRLKTGRNQGRKLFIKVCETCHGTAGRGNVTSNKKLKDNWGYRIWPRNLTRRESFRWVQNIEDLYRLISIGIAGTPMPEHASSLSSDERWAVARYVMSLSQTAPATPPKRAIIRGRLVKGALPTSGFHPLWHQSQPQTIRLLPNYFGTPPLYYGQNDRVNIRVLHNKTQIAIRLDIDDPSFSVPGDFLERRHAQAGIKPTRDAVAIRFLPKRGNGGIIPALWPRKSDEPNLINSWIWQAPNRTLKKPEALFETVSDHRLENSPLTGQGIWRNGQWRIVIQRDFQMPVKSSISFLTKRYLPISVVSWQGWAGQTGTRHGLSDWHWLYLEESRATPLSGK